MLSLGVLIYKKYWLVDTKVYFLSLKSQIKFIHASSNQSLSLEKDPRRPCCGRKNKNNNAQT